MQVNNKNIYKQWLEYLQEMATCFAQGYHSSILGSDALFLLLHQQFATALSLETGSPAGIDVFDVLPKSHD